MPEPSLYVLSPMKIIAWNMRRANASNDAAWDYFRELNADVALLQEITSIPEDVSSAYDSVFRYAQGKTGLQQKFGTAVLVKGRINRGIELSSEWNWVNEELDRFPRHGIPSGFNITPIPGRYARTQLVCPIP